jgi:threonine dehydrogenase-like Zn-dependent dehydrogenase
MMKDKMLCWPLHGVGLDKLGENQQPCTWDIPEPKADELLVRIDAIGLCFSDIKLIRAGEEHPRVISSDLAKDPVIPGHEAVMTVVKVGDKMKEQYQVGGRYIIQADIYVNGVGLAYGYAINGGMAEYSILDQRVLNGDEGSYLLPLADTTPAGLAALIEPWTCVIASYMIDNRTTVKADGRMLVAMEADSNEVYSFGKGPAASAPAEVDCLLLNPQTLTNLKNAFPRAKVNEVAVIPEDRVYDDIALCGIRNREQGEKLAKLGAFPAVISFVGEYADALWAFDAGSIHYKSWFYQGTEGADIAAAYGRNVRSKLQKGGSCWLLGGAGAMGQMHTQLAVEDDEGPTRILVTDLDQTRIDKMVERLAPRIKERGIEFQTLNPKDFADEAAFLSAVRDFAPAGFQDIVMLVPVVPVLNSAVSLLGQDGMMNIFAGIPAGKEANLNVQAIAHRGVRYIGSSGSRTHHLRHTLELVESGKLNPATALAAMGGMKALWEGLDGVANAKFAGKTVIFPHCLDMPLFPVEETASVLPEAADTMADGLYTLETEKALFGKFSSIDK